VRIYQSVSLIHLKTDEDPQIPVGVHTRLECPMREGPDAADAVAFTLNRDYLASKDLATWRGDFAVATALARLVCSLELRATAPSGMSPYKGGWPEFLADVFSVMEVGEHDLTLEVKPLHQESMNVAYPAVCEFEALAYRFVDGDLCRHIPEAVRGPRLTYARAYRMPRIPAPLDPEAP
jgi:hypothetical protein